MIDSKRTETETTITIEGDLILESDFKTKKSLIVKGNIYGKDSERWDIDARNINAKNINARDINAWNINAWNINARDINAWNINAWNIDARDIDAKNINAWNIDASDIDARDIDARDIIIESRIKKSEKATTKARIFITGKLKLERKEW